MLKREHNGHFCVQRYVSLVPQFKIRIYDKPQILAGGGRLLKFTTHDTDGPWRARQLNIAKSDLV